jgi:hypothetical protein
VSWLGEGSRDRSHGIMVMLSFRALPSAQKPDFSKKSGFLPLHDNLLFREIT